MRLATIATPDGLRLHVRARSGYVDVAEALGDPRFGSLHYVLEAGLPAMDAVRALTGAEGREVAEAEFGPAVPAPPDPVPGPELQRARPGRRPRGSHLAGRLRPRGGQRPGPVRRPGQAGPDRALRLRGRTRHRHRRGGRYISADKALDAIAGFVVLNDASARDWQRAASQWTAGKNFEGSMPLGPEVVTTDELDVSDLAISSTLNGQVMQSARTSLMLVDVPSAVEFFSSFTRLVPGDVIATGTPGGVGFARTPPVWMQPGDVIEITVEGLGSIRNRVVAEEGAPPTGAGAPAARCQRILTPPDHPPAPDQQPTE